MADRIKFYIMDEHVPAAVTVGLRLRGVDVLTAQEAGQLAAPDENQLSLAVSEGRVLFMQDADFLRLHAGGIRHAGSAYTHQQTPVGHIVRALMLVYQVLGPEDMQDHVKFL